jgi:cell division protein FtsI (penicillin-binding protein 3)
MARNVTVDQTLIKDPAATAAALAPLLGLPVEKITERITGDKRFNYVAKQITPDAWKAVAALEIPGIFSEPTTTRSYPNGALAANVVGYVGGEGHGLGGLEYGLDKQLSGSDGKLTVERVNGREIPSSERQSIDPTNGISARLTIDRDVQAMAERALADEVAIAGAKGGDVVVMDPKTGDIIALATYPTFNPNDPFATDDKTKRNPAVTDVFEPGSTSKVMTMAAVIEEGAFTPTSKFTIPAGLPRGGTTFHDHDTHGILHLTLNGVLAKSSNMGSILAAEAIGEKKFYGYLKKFGIGDETGMNFPGESAGLLPALKDWSGTTFPTLAFGQGLSVNAIQAASVFATIANDGVRMKPRLISGYTSSDGKYEPNTPGAGVKVVSPETAKTVREMLESVVSADGTAPDAQIDGYRIAGKTGTANKYDETTGGYSGYTASFIGMAPAENPSLVIAVMIHNPVNGHFGSTVSGPVFKKIMTYALAQQKIPPTKSKPPKIPVDW